MKASQHKKAKCALFAWLVTLLLLCTLFLAGCPDNGATLTPIPPCTHSYSSDCDKECDVCRAPRVTDAAHTYATPTLCEDKSCLACGELLRQTHDYTVTGGVQPTLLTGGHKDELCSKCGDTVTTTLPPLSAKELGMHAVYITERDDAALRLPSLTKEDGEIPVDYMFVSADESYTDFSCVATMKVQGATSASYPKKNYTVKLYKDDTLLLRKKVDFGWGKESKYCMKANYVDSSHARNIVGARLAAQVTASRQGLAQTLGLAPNYGLIDGFPILVYVNGSFHGLYTMNIPKDNWQLGMKKESETKQAILMGSAWRSRVRLEKPIGPEGPAYYGLEVEHCSTEDEAWIIASFNNVINTLITKDKAYIRRELPKYVDIDAAIDNFILAYAIAAADNVSKNVLWVTYDGVKWIPVMYDMDGTFGMRWNGTPNDPATDTTCVPYYKGNGDISLQDGSSQLLYALVRYFGDELSARYFALRGELLTTDNLATLFWEFQSGIAPEAYEADLTVWPSIPYGEENRDNMMAAFEAHLEKLDAFFFRLHP